MKWFKRIVFALLIVIGIVCYIQYPKLTLISGYSAKYIASSAFIANHSKQYIEANDNNIPNISLASNDLNFAQRYASASVFGLQRREAIYKEGLGAILLLKGKKAADLDAFLSPNRNKEFTQLPFPYGHLAPKDTILEEIDYQQIEKALDLVFSNPEIQKTRTALILYKGQLLGERYTEGFGPETPILGWSMTKSVIATLYGILAYEGALHLSDTLSISEWAADKRSEITINDLLRMQSGLAFEEDYSVISDVTEMLFASEDMGQVAMERPAIAPPAEIWSYSSGTTNILSKYLMHYSSDLQEYLDFPYRSLIDKIGMNTMLLETDISQMFVGSSYGWASTRDWAKFGQLYLNNGLWRGERIFSEDWVPYVTSETKASKGKYGAHFWLNKDGGLKDVPTDMYSANGHDGQHVYIIPSKDLVIVRTGLGENPDYRANDFIAAVLKALP